MSKKAPALAGIFVAFACASAQAGDPTTVGPVEAVAPNGLSITVLGQSFGTSSRAIIPGAVGNHVVSARAFNVGDFVLVTGKKLSNGSLVAKTIVPVDLAYVSGATDVYLSGRVTGFDSTLGIAQVGATSVYLADALVSKSAPIGIGSEIEVVGRQANPAGLIWASQIESAAQLPARDPASVLSIVRGESAVSGTQSIQGTGIQSIQGTGIQSIQGTGIQSIQGTGIQSIQGTGIQSIQGTGKQSIQGTGVQ